MAEQSSIPSGRGNGCFRNSSGSRNYLNNCVHHKMPTFEKVKENLPFPKKKKSRRSSDQIT